MPWQFPEYPENWEEIKKEILERAGYSCERCETKGEELHVHHILSLSQGGSSEPGNLMVLCRECHSQEHPHLPITKTVFGKCIFLKVTTDGKITCSKLPKKTSYEKE